jgi:hypothetical protein
MSRFFLARQSSLEHRQNVAFKYSQLAKMNDNCFLYYNVGQRDGGVLAFPPFRPYY